MSFNFCKKPIIYSLAGVCLAISIGFRAAPCAIAELDSSPKPEDIEPDNAVNRTLPIVKLKKLLGDRKGNEARALLAPIKQTVVNANLLHIWRGLIFKSERRPEEAIKEFDQCTDYTQTSVRGQHSIAGAYVVLEQYPVAVKILDTAINKVPFCDCYEMRACCNSATGHKKEAVADYRSAARLAIYKRRSLLSQAGQILFHEHKYAEAVALLNEAAADPEQSTDGPYFLCRAANLGGLGKWSQAADDCSSAIRIAQAGANRGSDGEQLMISRARMERALCYDHMGKKDLAAADRHFVEKFNRDTEAALIGK